MKLIIPSEIGKYHWIWKMQKTVSSLRKLLTRRGENMWQKCANQNSQIIQINFETQAMKITVLYIGVLFPTSYWIALKPYFKNM